MSNWLTLVSLLVQLALQIVRYLEGRQTLKQAEIDSIKRVLEIANETIRNANAARDAVTDNPDDIMRDPYNDAATGSTDTSGGGQGDDPKGSV